MSMNPILSILPTITEIVGAVCIVNENNHIKYSLYHSIDGNDVNIHFIKVGNDIKVINNTNSNILLVFPHENKIAGKVISIAPKSNRIITEEITAHASVGNKQIELVIPNFTQMKMTAENLSEVFLSGSGRIRKDIMGTVDINDKISIEAIDDNLFVLTKHPYVLKDILLLEITGQKGEYAQRYLNLTVPIEEKGLRYYIKDALKNYKSSDWIYVDINVSCEYDNNYSFNR